MSKNPFTALQQKQNADSPRTNAPRKSGQDSLALDPLRAHYLKRELVSLQFVKELSSFDSPTALAVLGPPFFPESRFVNGVPVESGFHAVSGAETNIDLPFCRFLFNHFVLTFPFLKNCPPTFFSHKIQPLVYSFVARNISSDSDAFDSGDGMDENTQKKVIGRVEKNFALLVSAAIRLADNDGAEQVVRVGVDGSSYTGVPLASRNPFQDSMNFSHSRTASQLDALAVKASKEEAFSVNVVSVRNAISRGKVYNKMYEEFIIRTRRKGEADVYVARRYSDFTKLTEALRKECLEESIPNPPTKDRRATDSAPVATEAPGAQGLNANMPTLARERNRLTLRAYLRMILNNPVLASAPAFQAFLLDTSITLLPSEMADVELREKMDQHREVEAAKFKSEVEGRVKELEGYLRGFREDLVKRNGLSRVFSTIRQTEKVEDLPIEYKKIFEWGRISLASTIYAVFLGSDNSSANLAQLKRVHGMMPYFVLRGILKISNPVAMIRAFLDLFLARPFGSTSLIQRLFSTGLTEEAKELREDAELVKRKIANDSLCQKVVNYVYASREIQENMIDQSTSTGQDIMLLILQSHSEPVLGLKALEYIQRASVRYEEYKYYRSQLADDQEDEGPDNDEAWLFEDLHVYRRLITKARDKDQLVELIFEGTTSEILKEIVTIFYEPLAQVYKAANIADSLGDLQNFINDLIRTVEVAEESHLTDPHKTVQIFVDLVQRHEGRFYNFVHQVHSKGAGLFDNLMVWIEMFINFVRDGLPSPVSLDLLLPDSGAPRAAIIKEIDAVVEHNRKLKLAKQEKMKKKILKGETTSEHDADVAFVNGVLENLHISKVAGDIEDIGDISSASEEDEGSSDDEGPEDAAGYRAQGGLQMLHEKGKKIKRAKMAPPQLKLIPQLVPVFVELIRPELDKVRL